MYIAGSFVYINDDPAIKGALPNKIKSDFEALTLDAVKQLGLHSNYTFGGSAYLKICDNNVPQLESSEQLISDNR